MSQDGQDGYDDSDVEWSDEEYAAYEAESASVARARSRRRKAAVTVALLALALFFAFWWAWSYYKESADGTKPTAGPSAGATCQPDGDGVGGPFADFPSVEIDAAHAAHGSERNKARPQ